MNKFLIFLLSLLIIIIGFTIVYYTIIYNPDKKNDVDITNENISTTTEKLAKTEIVNEEIANFQTTIYSTDPNRQNNVVLSCNILDGTILKSGETLSFTNTIGDASSENGFLEADIFDADGNKIKGVGGGICQVSTTLYNCALELEFLEIIERHPHTNSVPYIEEGKDAAVSYGSIDLKIKNNESFDVNILCAASNEAVSIIIESMKEELVI